MKDGIDEVLHEHGVGGVGVGKGDVDVPHFGFGESGFGGSAEFQHAGLVAGEGELIVFEDDFAACAGDFQAVGAGRFACGGNKDARGAVGVFQIRGDAVFHLDVVEASELHEAAHFDGHTAHPLEGVELMEALVEEDAAAFAFPSGSPSTAGVVGVGSIPVGNDPVDADDFAQFAICDEPSDFGVSRLGPKLKHGGKYGGRMLAALGDKPLGVRFVRRNWFFDHEMQAGVQRLYAQRGVLVVGRGDDDGVNLARLDQGFSVAVNCQRFVGFQLVRRRAANRLQHSLFDRALAEIIGVVPSHVAHADDADSNRIHASPNVPQSSAQCNRGKLGHVGSTTSPKQIWSF